MIENMAIKPSQIRWREKNRAYINMAQRKYNLTHEYINHIDTPKKLEHKKIYMRKFREKNKLFMRLQIRLKRHYGVSMPLNYIKENYKSLKNSEMKHEIK
jgi:hypothetical protein